MKVELLTEADRVLSNCGRVVAPSGLGWVDIPKGLQYQKYLADNAADTTEEKVVDTPVPFILKSFQGFGQPGAKGAVYFQIRFPSGRFVESRICPISESVSYGSYREYLDPPVECQPGSRFWITLDGLLQAGTDVALTLLFEGVLRYTIKGSAGCVSPVSLGSPWAKMPRYVMDGNQNIEAPEWRLGTQQWATPSGYRDEVYWLTATSPNFVAVPIDGSVVQAALDLDYGGDFIARYVRFYVIPNASGITGTPYVRIRRDDGYEVTDGFVNATRINTVMFPGLPLKSGTALIIEYMLVDAGGALGSTLTIQPVFGGLRRRKL
jgi:hypothetical protein